MVVSATAAALAPNGSFVRLPDGGIFRIAGGAPIHVGSCEPLAGCPGLQPVSDLAGYASVPADGTYLRVADGPSATLVVRVVGGAPIGIGTCNALSGCETAVDLDDGGWRAYQQAHPTVPDGRFVRIADGARAGVVTRAVGGALIPLGSCAPLGGCPDAVSVDGLGIASYAVGHPWPADGTFVRIADGPSTGTPLRAAGGALLALSDCIPLRGCPGAVVLDAAGLADYAREHPRPADGTLLTGVPSGTTWLVAGGTRQATTGSSRAIDVNDATLSMFPLVALVKDPSVSTSGVETETTTPPVAPRPLRSLPEFTVSFASAAARRGAARIGLVLGLQVTAALPAGTTVRVACVGCGFTKSYRIKKAIRSRTGLLAFGRKLPVTRTTRISVQISAAGRDGRFTVFSFKKRRYGLSARTVRTGCRSESGAHRTVPCG
jgi:hypothetical protein